MKRHAVCFFVLCASFFHAMPGYSQNASIPDTGRAISSGNSTSLPYFAHVDTIRGRLAASGVGVAAERFTTETAVRRAACFAAELDARRNLVELAHGIGLDSSTILENYAPKSDAVRTNATGILGPVAVERKAMIKPRTCRVTVSAEVPRELRHMLPHVIDPMEPTTEIRAPMINRPE